MAKPVERHEDNGGASRFRVGMMYLVAMEEIDGGVEATMQCGRLGRGRLIT